MAGPDVLAAGAVVFRPGREVLLIHRPKYDDWSFPKGKADPGEHVAVAAVREVREETGVGIRLGPALRPQRYQLSSGGTKQVAYWVGRVVGDDDVSQYPGNDEVDLVQWVPYDEALVRLDYPHDRATLREAVGVRRKTYPLMLLRHAEAVPRRDWATAAGAGDDRDRPLTEVGARQATDLVPLLAAFGPTRVITSGSCRCVETVRPFATEFGIELVRESCLSEEEASPAAVSRLVAELVAGKQGVVVCSHRPVLPDLAWVLGLTAPALAPGELLVAHLRRGLLVAHERQPAS